jgi:hypothetical protein
MLAAFLIKLKSKTLKSEKKSTFYREKTIQIPLGFIISRNQKPRGERPRTLAVVVY